MGFPHKLHPKETAVLSQHFGDADARTFKGWTKRGGYEALAQALKSDPVAGTDIVKESGVRGRGGGGVPPRPKGAVLAEGEKSPPSLCGKAGGTKPGAVKEREVMRR